ncbi:hypothetical protein AAE478_008472 [Parahypoxylon ruwenzoriense]
MQPPRIIICRLLVLRPSKSPSTARLFTRNTNVASRVRPQIPFLSVPLARNHQFRYLTTERKRWLAYEVYLGVKYTIYIWAIIGISIAGYWSIQQEWLERRYPTPHEWGFLTRLRFRLARWAPDRTDLEQIDWVLTGNYVKNVVERLEDASIEGAGLQDLTDGGVWIDGVGKSGYDVTAKTEPWRRGYYESLMLCAKAAEHLDDQVVDKTRHVVFPANQVMGPSNPNPQPIPAGSPSAPREEDCERAFEPPETYYIRILTTRGFSSKQKLDAALEYGSWLDFKGLPDASEKIYEWALSLATENLLPAAPLYDPQSYVLLDDAHQPSENLLKTLTALATHKARSGDVSSALPILISVLRARRSLPQSQPKSTRPASDESEETHSSPWTFRNIISTARRLVSPPPYPPPPDDGEAPPIRDAGELCEEAGLHLYIGEILYSSHTKGSGSPSEREDGLAWTREAVDLAEEQLHRLARSDNTTTAATNNKSSRDSDDFAAKKICRECLVSGLDNWQRMVARLAREEREHETEKQQQNASGAGSSWWGVSLWGEGKSADATAGGRWTAEENVVRERMRRAQELLEEAEAPKSGGIRSLVYA